MWPLASIHLVIFATLKEQSSAVLTAELKLDDSSLLFLSTKTLANEKPLTPCLLSLFSAP